MEEGTDAFNGIFDYSIEDRKKKILGLKERLAEFQEYRKQDQEHLRMLSENSASIDLKEFKEAKAFFDLETSIIEVTEKEILIEELCIEAMESVFSKGRL